MPRILVAAISLVYLTGEFGTVYSADLLIKGIVQDVAVKQLNGNFMFQCR